MSFWADKSVPEQITQSIEITKDKCFEMAQTKTCKIYTHEIILLNMQCDETMGWYDEKISPQYEWWSKISVTRYTCSVIKRAINAKNETLFNTCKIKDNLCKFNNKIIVWDYTRLNKD